VSGSADRPRDRRPRSVELQLDEFAWEALDAECAQLGVGIEDLLAFSLLYYLADLDSGRIARNITRSPYPPADAPRTSSR
jgi:hypothetical protein